MEAENSLLLEVEAYVTNFITEQVPRTYAYHDVQHTLNVVAAVSEIGERMGITEKEKQVLKLAAWFHDTGYDKGPTNHEERSCKYAAEYLLKQDYNEDDLKTIQEMIHRLFGFCTLNSLELEPWLDFERGQDEKTSEERLVIKIAIKCCE